MADVGLRARGRELLSQGDKLFAARYPLMSLWQQMAENFHVMRADFTRKRYFSEEFASYLMTGRPALAHRDLANAIPAMMRPRGQQWLWMRTPDEKINNDRSASVYLDWASGVLFQALYDERSCFVRSTKEGDGDYAAFGQCVFSVDPNRRQDGLLIRGWHLRDVVFTENPELKINQVHHKRTNSVRDVVGMWPKNHAAELDTRMREDPDGEVALRRIVVPSDEYDLVVPNKERFPFVVLDVDEDNERLLAETPAKHLHYVIPRWVTISGTQYAYSPAAVYGLPDARMLQQMTLTMLEAGQKATDPPLIATAEAIVGAVNLQASTITWVDADYDERTGEVLRPLDLRFDGIQYGAAREERVEQTLEQIFYLNQLRFPQITKDMTAYESNRLYEEFVRQSLPLFEPIEVEYNGGLVSAAYEVLSDLINPATGAPFFGSPYDVPTILRGRDIRWHFDTPLKAAAAQQKQFKFQTMVQTLAAGMQIDKSIVFNVDMNKGVRDAIVGAGSGEWLVDEKVAAQRQQDQQQADQAAAQAQAMATHADTASKLATAASSAGDAVKSLGVG